MYLYRFCTVFVQVEILSSLDHPSIIHYYGTATHNNVHYIVTGLPNISYRSAVDGVTEQLLSSINLFSSESQHRKHSTLEIRFCII